MGRSSREAVTGATRIREHRPGVLVERPIDNEPFGVVRVGYQFRIPYRDRTALLGRPVAEARGGLVGATVTATHTAGVLVLGLG